MTNTAYEFLRFEGEGSHVPDSELMDYVLYASGKIVETRQDAVIVYTSRGSIESGENEFGLNEVTVRAFNNDKIPPLYLIHANVGHQEIIEVNPSRLPFVGELAKYSQMVENYD